MCFGLVAGGFLREFFYTELYSVALCGQCDSSEGDACHFGLVGALYGECG